ncbi:hypothetical protein [Roseomonas genomospecies 6]|uniref:Uncharacterized protein n=1 Tax=Roseomonas genomospecies 6 TaxID=214106 RepID=A0A9W7KR72_9PROT|nr:hypothetical protein [Roseomonas genomospecies 6]KAA0678257.1 hypothetical protein DS843_20605 [Roseomonas genomospecies 6]
MSTQIPCDADGVPIPALRLKPGGGHALAVTAASGRIGPFDPETCVVTVFATGPVLLRSGAATVTAAAGDHFFPEGVYATLSLGGAKNGRHTHLAAVRATADCLLYVSEME